MPHRATSPSRVGGFVALVLVSGTVFAWPTANVAGSDEATVESALPEGFAYAQEQMPDLAVDLRYLGSDNFVGRPIAGYEASRVILTEAAATALAGVQRDLATFGLGLLVYDAYRPTRAVADFVAWAQDPTDTEMKARYYPDVDKEDLIPGGYIAPRSSHSRGSTVDVTLVSRGAGPATALDMGTGFDLFSPRSWPTSTAVSPSARAHRLLLQTMMAKHGFVPYPQEWWHFTLRDEPFPDTYFDFPVR